MAINHWFRSVILLAFACIVPCARAQNNPGAALKMVQLEEINVSGTRLPAKSVIRLSGLKVGDKVNDLIVNQACRKITATGLVRSVDYFYDVYPDKAGVALTLTMLDEGDLLPARIQTDADDGPIWTALQARDAIFSRQMPRTEKALDFYTKNIEDALVQLGRKEEYAEALLVNNAAGEPAGIVFEIRKYKDH